MAREFEVISGGSGRWMAREVFERWPNGRTARGGEWCYRGHAPRVPEHAAIIGRQLQRQVTGVDKIDLNRPTLGGGWEYNFRLEDGRMIEIN